MPGHHIDLNRSAWQTWAAVHGQDRYDDSEGLVTGRDSLTDLEWDGVRAVTGDVAGRDVLHVQCHLAFDAITLARRGARVTGVDFAPAALAKARDLATRCGVDLELVEGDATDLPAEADGRHRLRIGGYCVPVLYTLIAERPAEHPA